MKDKILALRSQGKSYREIEKELGCSKGTISYHCGMGQKEKNNVRLKRFKETNPLSAKTEKFRTKKAKNSKTRDFQRKDGSSLASRLPDRHFTWRDVQERLEETPICYLTGKSINIDNPKEYNFDHIIPATKGGQNTLENLGIATPDANYAKGNLLLDEFIELCKDVLTHHGYEIKKK